jgi:ribosomal protein L40E
MAGLGRVTVSDRRSTGDIGPSVHAPAGLNRTVARFDTHTVDERACPSCGAQNAATAEYCWQCLTRFGGPPAGAPEGSVRGSALRAALGTGPGAGTPAAVLTEPVTTTRWQPQHSTDRMARVAVKVLVGLVAALVGFVGYRWLTRGFPFPGEIAGFERTDAEESEQASAAIESIAQVLGVEVEAAFYGDVLQPTYVMSAFEMPAEGPLVGVQPFGGAPGGGGIRFQCGPDAQGAACVWEQDGRLVGIAGVGQTVEQLEPVARQVHAELQD